VILERSTILGIELRSDQLRIIQGALSEGLLKVHDFASEELVVSTPESAAQQLEALVARKKWRSSSATLALSGPEVVHQILDFPPMPTKELELVVQREMRMSGAAEGKDVVFDWEVIEEGDAGNLKPPRVLVAIAPSAQVKGAQQLLDQCRLKAAVITTAPLALLRSLRFCQGEGSGLRVLLYLGSERGYLLGVKDGAWSFYREFSTRSSGERGDLLLGETLKEVHRALLYQQQRHQGPGEIGFLLCGEKALPDLQARLAREMGVQAEIIRPGPALNLESLEERGAIFRDLFPSLIIPLGLLAAGGGEAGINFARKTRPHLSWGLKIDWSIVSRPAAMVVVFLFILGLHLFLVYTERRYQNLLQERSALYAQWRPAIGAAEESQALHDSQRLVLQSLGLNHNAEPLWVPFFKLLSRLVPADLVLHTLSLQEDKGEWLITLKGEVVSLDVYTAQSHFNRFYENLKSLPQVERIELLPLRVSTLKERIEAPQRKVPEASASEGAGEVKTEVTEIKKTKVEFEIRAHSKGI